MSGKISSLKGVRTKYRNTLETELHRAKDILKSDVSTLPKVECLKDIQKCKSLLKLYSEKLSSQLDKLAESLEESDSEYLETVLDLDCSLNFEVENCIIDLDQFCEILMSPNPSDGNKDTLQEQMKKLMLTQMDQQQKLMAHIEKEPHKTSAVKLPKLDLEVFFGKKVKWCEFWDSFDCVVHKNDKLSDVEKFNYLISKVGGEAKRAIAGLSRTSDNYSVAIAILRERYGNIQEIVDLHYKEMLGILPPTSKVESLRIFMDKVEKNLRSLEMLGENVNQHLFVSMIRTKLPEDVLRQLEIIKGAKNEWTVDSLRCHLRDFITACEKADKSKSGKADEAEFHQNNRGTMKERSFTSARNDTYIKDHRYQRNRSNTETFLSNENTKQNISPTCKYCTKNHWSDECSRYSTVEERKKQLKGCCYRCLKSGHGMRDCKSNRVCVYCNEYNKHHRSLCSKRFKQKAMEDTQMNVAEQTVETPKIEKDEENAMLSHGETVFMQTAQAEIHNPKSSASVTERILLDCGSQRTYISQSLVDKLGLKKQHVEELRVFTFGGKEAKVIKTHVTTIKLKLKNGQFLCLDANIVPVISGNIQRKALNEDCMDNFKDLADSLDLADTFPDKSETSEIELLIGNDYYLDLVLQQRIEIYSGLYLLCTRLGWVLTGRSKTDLNDNNIPSMLILTHGSTYVNKSEVCGIDNPVKPLHELEDFWNIEAIGIHDKDKKDDDELSMKRFEETLTFENGRYNVTWPWKEEIPELPQNKELAFGRLRSCLKRLKNKPEMLEKYDYVIKDQLCKGVIEKVTDRNDKNHMCHYLPHHAVITPHKSTTQLRVVYDASAKVSKEAKNLNENLCRGPVLLRDLCGLLMRFRLYNVAMVADIEKAFLQVGLQESERDVTRFFWVKDTKNAPVSPDNIDIYRFCRVPFGIIASPFLECNDRSAFEIIQHRFG